MSDSRVPDSLLKIAVEFTDLTRGRDKDVQDAFRVWLEYKRQERRDRESALPGLKASDCADADLFQEPPKDEERRADWEERAEEYEAVARQEAFDDAATVRAHMQESAPLDISSAERVVWLVLLVNKIIETDPDKTRSERLGLRRFSPPITDIFDDLYCTLETYFSDLASYACEQEATLALDRVKKDWGVANGSETQEPLPAAPLASGGEGGGQVNRRRCKSPGRPGKSQQEWVKLRSLAKAWEQYRDSPHLEGRGRKVDFLKDYNEQYKTNYGVKDLDSGLRQMRR